MAVTEPDQAPEPVDVQPVAAPPALQIIIPAPLVAQLPAVVQPAMAQQAGQQQQQQVQQQQAAPASPAQPGNTDKLRGSILLTFTGDRCKSEKFM